MRERAVKRTLILAGLGALTAAGVLTAAPQANAIPPGPYTCVGGGGGFIGGGSYEDCDLWPDGSFWHRWTGYGPFAWGGGAGRVCDGMPPVPTDMDPTTPCPGVGPVVAR